MRKVILVILFITSCNVYSQTSWKWLNPYPTNEELGDCYFVNENIGWVIGSSGSILKTTNGGFNWVNQSTMTYLPTSINFINEDIGYVTANDWPIWQNSLILKTTNSGLNWIEISYHANSQIKNSFFINEKIGFIVGELGLGGFIGRTTNGGINWEITNLSNVINSIYFLNHDTGYIAGWGLKYKTTDNGLVWNQLTSDSVFCNYNSLFFNNKDTGYAIGWTKLKKTINAGENWTVIDSNKNFQSIHFLNSNTGFISWRNPNNNIRIGGMLKTINSGESWDSINLNSYKRLNGFSFPGNGIGYCVGDFGTVYRTSNSGANWSNRSINLTEIDLTKAFFTSSKKGHVIGKNGVYLRTSNGGAYWSAKFLTSGNSLTSINFVDENVGYISDDNGYFYKTIDGGLNWSSAEIFDGWFIGAIYFINKDTGFVFGSGMFSMTSIFMTTNGGDTWVNQNNITYSEYACHFPSDSIGFACGWRTVSRTTNSGLNWLWVYTDDSSSFRSIHFVNEKTGYAAGQNLVTANTWRLIKTTNGGNNWTHLNFPYGTVITSIRFSDANSGFVTVAYPGGNREKIVATTDGGNSWRWYSEYSGLPFLGTPSLRDIFILNDGSSCAVGDDGTIIKTDKISTVGIQNVSFETPSSFSLSQNYPNPFNPSTKIKFDIPKGAFVKLKIYDMLGREVAELVNEKLNPGSYEYEWNGIDLSSGIYFYKLEAENFIQTKRMVLIK